MQLSESQSQQALISWANNHLKDYPELRLLFHPANGEYRTKSTGSRLKSMGVVAGVSDLCLPVSRGDYNVLFIEMKTLKGNLTKAQAIWSNLVVLNGGCYKICRSWEDGRDTLLWYLGLDD